ncbi:imelysin family protein [uncultured Polaribacter sp.]|uniref:imelysin family protein n=1 Tax=uncultured Polaribacter sp. TaxID=174711 RepID=UPI00261C376A|nr:imelysin family protein [uncultured Polaribacter sp.]
MFKKISILFLSVSIFVGCNSSEEPEPTVTDNFDRQAMLTNITDNIILPAYEDFSTKMNALKSDGTTFASTPTLTNLENLRTSWLVAYKSWQHIEMFNLGKAEELEYSFYMNIYPLTVSDVENNIATGSYDLNSSNNHDAQGFPALDYLLFGVADSDTAILAKYESTPNGNNYAKYLLDVLSQMNTLTEQVVLDFKSNRDSFVTSTANTATSNVNKLINDYIFYYEKGLRAGKFGIPAGIFSSTPLPEKVEGYYSKIYSKDLALEALSAVKIIFKGDSNTTSFAQYLEALNRGDLASSIKNQFELANTQINTLNVNFSEQVNTDNSAMLKSYDELQKAVILLKLDMLQALNVSVDYRDSDGD